MGISCRKAKDPSDSRVFSPNSIIAGVGEILGQRKNHGISSWLEVVAEAELHTARRVLHGAVGAKVALREALTEIEVAAIEPDAVRDVEALPVEFESAVLPEPPGLGQSHVEAEGAVSTEV